MRTMLQKFLELPMRQGKGYVKFFTTFLHLPTLTVCLFLGLASYYHQYVYQFAKIAHPLTQLLMQRDNLIKND